MSNSQMQSNRLNSRLANTQLVNKSQDYGRS